MFIASDECVLCWGRTLLALETNVFELEINTLGLEKNALKTRAPASVTHTASYTHSYRCSYTHSNECIENARLNFSHTHTHS